MNARVFTAEVMHARLEPVNHSFRYPVHGFIFDLDDLSALSKRVPLFGYNTKRLISIHDSDYLGAGSESIQEKLLAYLRNAECADRIERIELLTSPRYFNYAFNPVSFYYCYRADGSVRATVAEVNNTFRERHLYILDTPANSKSPAVKRYTVPKAFHVSPFNDMKGDYDFHFSELTEKFDIRINIQKEGREVFLSRLHGRTYPLTTASLLKTIATAPVRALLTIPRIYFQALVLHYKKGMPVITKPNPSSPNTIKAAPPVGFEKFSLAYIRSCLKSVKFGELQVLFPDGHTEIFKGATGTERAEMVLNNYYLFPKLLKGGSIGLGDSYVNGDWDSPDPAAALKFFLNNWEAFSDKRLNILKPFRWLNRFKHFLQRNSVKQSKDNISAHYDLSNELFQKFLDPSMTYSSAIFRSQQDSLEHAQLNKIDHILYLARVRKEDHVLEIGSGWGALAIRAAGKTGCRVTSISLSIEQLKLARERAADSSLTEKISFEALDYRNVKGQYDKIVSVEMMEAVGKEYLPVFFQTCERLLKPNGVAVLQVIAFPDHQYKEYLTRQDWIQKRIFPGSHLPSLTSLLKSMSENTTFVVERVENIAPHYARTLHEWRERFEDKWSEIEALGFDQKFRRSWNFYLASCEAEFATRWLAVYQLVLTRPNNQNLVSEDRGRSQASPHLELISGSKPNPLYLKESINAKSNG